jgi:hyperosmotically inducible periplasmic protein
MSKKWKYPWAFYLLGSCLLSGPSLAKVFQEQTPPAADNTKTNQRDNDKNSPTADQQKMNPQDRAITQKIRAAIHDDKSLSTYAHNVKIISQNGKVTLRGPVRSQDEKANIEAKALIVAGDGNVDNELEIVPQKQ